jgi:pyridoxamine 5'-phosphate oxidase family protein
VIVTMFTDKEIAYLQAHLLGRLATTGKTGMPHVIPTGYRLDTDSGTIKIGQHVVEGRGQQRLYLRQLAVNPQAAFVVDDLTTEPTWTPSGITIKGTVTMHAQGGEALNPGFGPNWIEIIPTWISSWGINAHHFEPAAPRKA